MVNTYLVYMQTKISPEDSTLIDRAILLCGGYEGLAKDFPWEAAYISRVRRGEKPMSEQLRWALQAVIKQRESQALPIGLTATPLREKAPPPYGLEPLTIYLQKPVLDALKTLAEDSRQTVDGIIQSAAVKYISEYRSHDQLPIFRPSTLTRPTSSIDEGKKP